MSGAARGCYPRRSLYGYIEVDIGKRLIFESEMPPLGVVTPEASAFHYPLQDLPIFCRIFINCLACSV